MSHRLLQSRWTVAIAVAIVAPFASVAQSWGDEAATLFVANNGTDGPSCGAIRGAPCRSITQALLLAADGDRIVVGPGRYGDLNGNGVVDPGEEAAEVGFGCLCMIKIDKRVILESADGAGATSLDTGSLNLSSEVRIQADGVIFGFFTDSSTAPGD